MNEKFAAKWESLSHRVWIIANDVDTTRAEDLAQEMAITFINKVASDPEFLDRPDDYIATFLEWRARDLTRREVRKAKREIETAEPIDTGVAKNTESEYIERETILELRDIAQDLGNKNADIIAMTYEGYSYTEIANHLGISNSTVTRRRQAIEKKHRRLYYH